MIRAALASCALMLALCGPGAAQDAERPGAATATATEQPSVPDAASEKPNPPGASRTVPETLAEAIGTWDMSLEGGNRRCQLSLSGDSTQDGRVLRFPAGCRRALPALAQAAGWLFADKGIRIVDRNLRPLISFVPRQDQQSLVGRDEHGGTYNLVPLQIMAMLPPPPPAIDAPTMPGAGAASIADVDPARDIPGAQPVLPSDVLRRSEPPARTEPAAAHARDSAASPIGTYALDRFSDKDVCRIALETRPVGAKAGHAGFADLSPARIVPGCRDGGITTFDPVSWRFANGHLTLKARRGHAINLVRTRDGAWRRDPDTGTTLILRKLTN